MAKRNRNVKSEIIQKCKEDYGQGELFEYKPWLPIGIKAPLLPVTRVLANKTDFLVVLRRSDNSLVEVAIEVKPTNKLASKLTQ